MSLLSDSEISALRSVAESAMSTAATIMKRSIEQTDDGDRDIWTATTTVYGMLYSEPQPLINVISGVMGIVDVLKFRLPVGTAVTSGDHLLIAGLTYTVEDADEDSTYLPWLRLSLRRIG